MTRNQLRILFALPVLLTLIVIAMFESARATWPPESTAYFQWYINQPSSQLDFLDEPFGSRWPSRALCRKHRPHVVLGAGSIYLRVRPRAYICGGLFLGTWPGWRLVESYRVHRPNPHRNKHCAGLLISECPIVWEEQCSLTTRWSGPWTIVGRTLVANRLLAGSACGKRQRGRPLNSVVRRHVRSLTACELLDAVQRIEACQMTRGLRHLDSDALGRVYGHHHSTTCEAHCYLTRRDS